MTLLALAVVVATVLGFAFRGSLDRFGRPPLQRNGVLAFAVLAQITALLALHPGVYAGWLGSGAVALVVYARLNRGRPGLFLAASGLLLNVLVIFVNWGMPRSLAAAERAGMPADRLALGSDPLHSAVDSATLLPWLTESIPLALPLWPTVASLGDLLAAAGAAVFIFTGLTGRGRQLPAARPAVADRHKKKKRTGHEASPNATGESTTAPGASAGAEGGTGGATAVQDEEIGAAADAIFSPRRASDPDRAQVVGPEWPPSNSARMSRVGGTTAVTRASFAAGAAGSGEPLEPAVSPIVRSTPEPVAPGRGTAAPAFLPGGLEPVAPLATLEPAASQPVAPEPAPFEPLAREPVRTGPVARERPLPDPWPPRNQTEQTELAPRVDAGPYQAPAEPPVSVSPMSAPGADRAEPVAAPDDERQDLAGAAGTAVEASSDLNQPTGTAPLSVEAARMARREKKRGKKLARRERQATGSSAVRKASLPEGSDSGPAEDVTSPRPSAAGELSPPREAEEPDADGPTLPPAASAAHVPADTLPAGSGSTTPAPTADDSPLSALLDEEEPESPTAGSPAPVPAGPPAAWQI